MSGSPPDQVKLLEFDGLGCAIDDVIVTVGARRFATTDEFHAGCADIVDVATLCEDLKRLAQLALLVPLLYLDKLLRAETSGIRPQSAKPREARVAPRCRACQWAARKRAGRATQ